ncbi:aminotransferase class V-fold PLP-dependent enzyme [Paenibacillus cymbidii]|uniref:aminotransferase class V-fold PLP-dependent enzyme n=1 Tax=Paenibacillus cymbidii TaxID=1639034 RepID=UPI00107FD966|nr:aminotransferase class V-fold PLP-dependent enzyme [Paenibacillus cymbidii]
MDPYESIGLPRVVNAAGKMTYLGSSAVLPEVAEAMAQAAQSYVDMAALKRTINDRTGGLAGAEAACVTASAAAGIVISVAAALTGTDLAAIEALPDITGPKREVILQKGHVVNFGANLAQMIRMTGARLVEIGTVNGVKPYHLESALSETTAAIVYVVSHHAVSNEMLTLPQVAAIAAKRGVPVIVDAAAEVDLALYISQGADLVVYSGHKAIGGPTSGLIVGRKPLIDACMMQEKGYGRAMKLGKENLIGFYKALEAYVRQQPEAAQERCLRVTEELQRELADLPGIATSIVWDATRPIPRLLVTVQAGAGRTAKEVIRLLEAGNPSIRTRNHLVDEGIIQFDPRELKPEETKIIRQALTMILT